MAQSGQEISDLFPHIAAIADEICIVRSMQTEQINHDPAHAFMNTGLAVKGRPSMGSWLLYGLGAETDNLPGFIVLTSARQSRGAQPVSARQWSAGFLPSKFQGIQFQSKGDAVHYVGNPEGVCQSTQRQVVEEVNQLNGMLADGSRGPRDSDTHRAIRTRLPHAELRARSHGPFAGKRSRRSPLRRASSPATAASPRIACWRDGWPSAASASSSSITAPGIITATSRRTCPIAAADVDKPSAALVKDLKQRGMLDDTLIIWGGEFGRTPMGQGTGRDHHILTPSPSGWPAAASRAGVTYGATDELGYRAVEDSRRMSTTCTPRCSTSAASTTSGSPSASRVAISG